MFLDPFLHDFQDVQDLQDFQDFQGLQDLQDLQNKEKIMIIHVTNGIVVTKLDI